MWAAPVTLTPPAQEPATLSEAKEFLIVEDDTTDVLISSFIIVAREQIEAVTGTRLVDQTVELSADGFADLMRFPIGPVVSIDELAYLDSAGVEQVMDPTEYELFGAGLEQGLRPVFGGSWPSAARRAGAIRVTASIGYEALPKPLWLAILLMVGDMFANRETVTMGPQATVIPMSTQVENLLANYRIWL